MKNYFMLTYICHLFSPSVTGSRFSSISKALKPILYVCRSAFSIELRLKYHCVVGKVWQEETNSFLLCEGLEQKEKEGEWRERTKNEGAGGGLRRGGQRVRVIFKAEHKTDSNKS